MPAAFSPRLRLLAGAFAALLLLIVGAAGWFYAQMRASLPLLDGPVHLAGLTAPVTLTRDDFGVPTIQAASRTDAARALGFVHAQDRFFQMDLLRRRAAGELAELFGAAALPLDRRTRPHGFRVLARQVLANASHDQRELIEHYTAGVNAGRAALRQKPFEYFVLRADPAPWRPEDSILVIYAITLDLQDANNTYERSLMTLRDTFGGAAAAFFAPLIAPDDAALDGSTAPLPAIPGPAVIDLRQNQNTLAASRHAPADTSPGFHPGSNAFILDASRSASGTALLANDPHLNLSVPNIWYRAVLEWPETTARRRLLGATIPGLPFVVIGSNGDVAWGLTAAYADTSDLVVIDTNPIAPHLYRFPGDEPLREIEVRTDTLHVKGGAPEVLETHWTQWGPIIATDSRNRPLALRWTAHDPAAVNLSFVRLETARNTQEAIAIAHDSGLPAVNFLAVDRHGAIGWTIAGKLPNRTGFDGRFPVSWSYGDRRWDGFLPAEDVPTILAPTDGQLWSANHRMLGGEALTRIGDGDYAAPARAAQIRDRLSALKTATPPDLLAIQLDDRARSLDRWRDLILDTLDSAATRSRPKRAEFRQQVYDWDGHAGTGSVGYRLVRTYRTIVADRVLGPIFARCVERQPDFNWRRFHYEPALWTLIEEQPEHLLSPSFDSWRELLLTVVDETIAEIEEDGSSISQARWGDHNRARIRHPFSHFLPDFVARRLNLPPDPLPGGTDMPLIQSPSFGASLRIVVSPGREDEGLFHMPGGQSGHPLSPFYRAGHENWVRGRPAPLLPGAPRHTLVLNP